jgi:hypothetical protein
MNQQKQTYAVVLGQGWDYRDNQTPVLFVGTAKECVAYRMANGPKKLRAIAVPEGTSVDDMLWSDWARTQPALYTDDEAAKAVLEVLL